MDMKVKIVGIFKDKISTGLRVIQEQTERSRTGFKKFTDQMKVGAKSARAGINKLGKSFGGIAAGAAAGAAAGVASLVAITKEATTAGRELRNLAQAANTPVEEFQKMAFGAEQFGISQDTLSGQLKDFKERIGEFTQTGGGPLVDFFDQVGTKVGVTIEDFQKLSGAEGIQLFQNSLEKANLSQEDMIFYLESVASDLTQLQPLLTNNGKLLKQSAAEAENLGIVLSAVEVDQLAEGENTFQKLQSLMTNVANIVGVTLLPYIQELANSFIGVATESGGFGEVAKNVVNATIRGFAKVGDVLNGLKVVFNGLELIALGFVSAFVFGLNQISKILATSVEGWIIIINEAIGGLNSLGADIEKIEFDPSESGIVKGIDKLSSYLTDKVIENKAKLNEMALADTPSQMAEKFIAQAEKRAEADRKASEKRVAAAKIQSELDRKELKAKKELRIATETQSEADKKAAEIKKQADKEALDQQKILDAAQDEAVRERTRNMESLIGTVSNTFSTFFKDIGNGSKDAFGNLVSNFKDTVNNLVAEALASKLMNALFGDITPTIGSNGQVSGGSTGGILSELFNGVFGRETGGGVRNNMPYIVGEKRPEIFVPRQDGTIIPNLSMVGSGSTQVNINAIDSKGVAQFIDENKFALTGAVQNASRRYNMRS